MIVGACDAQPSGLVMMMALATDAITLSAPRVASLKSEAGLLFLARLDLVDDVIATTQAASATRPA
jgi:hypothetical protein